MIGIDGSHGEGGGQILRTALSLAAILGQAVRIERIRAGRRNPGLAPQHVSSIRAVAQVCDAALDGASLGSQTLTFVPRGPLRAGDYNFDVTEAARGGSAGAVSLVFQALVLPLALAHGRSRLVLKGGTHVSWSPPAHYLDFVYLPALRRLGIDARDTLEKLGFYPVGGGVLAAEIEGTRESRTGTRGRSVERGGAREERVIPPRALKPASMVERGNLVRVRGISAVANLPDHIARRQARHAAGALAKAGLRAEVQIVEAPSPGRGTCVFLVAEYEHAVAGFTGLGQRGKPAEQVAQEAVDDLLVHHNSGASLDRHLADQLVLPLALAAGTSECTTSQVSQHLLTNAWVVEQFLPVRIRVDGSEGGPGRVVVTP